jgi:hypothetical protein
METNQLMVAEELILVTSCKISEIMISNSDTNTDIKSWRIIKYCHV